MYFQFLLGFQEEFSIGSEQSGNFYTFNSFSDSRGRYREVGKNVTSRNFQFLLGFQSRNL